MKDVNKKQESRIDNAPELDTYINANDLVSIIVPVYNVNEYLIKCIESLKIQSYTNIEILLIDDGSNDGSDFLCDELCKTDTRIRVIHKINGGLSSARNVGITNSKGKFVSFVDSDDYVSKDFILTLLKMIIINDADISVCDYFTVFEDGTTIKNKKSKSFSLLTNIQAIRDILLPSTLCSEVAWNKLYKMNLFTENNIRFPEGKIHEDVFTTYRLFYNSRRVVYRKTPLYYYVQRQSSIIGVGYTNKNLAMVEGCDEIFQLVLDTQLPIIEEALGFRITRTLYLISILSDKGFRRNKEDWQFLVKWLSAHRREIYSNKYISISQKFTISIIYCGRWPYACSRLINQKICSGVVQILMFWENNVRNMIPSSSNYKLSGDVVKQSGE